METSLYLKPLFDVFFCVDNISLFSFTHSHQKRLWLQSGSRASFVRSPKSQPQSQQPLNLFDMMSSPKFQSPSLTSPLAFGSGSMGGGGSGLDTQRLTDEILSLRNKLVSWEDSWNQAKMACEAWKREATEQAEKAKAIDRERIQCCMKVRVGLSLCAVLSSLQLADTYTSSN